MNTRAKHDVVVQVLQNIFGSGYLFRKDLPSNLYWDLVYRYNDCGKDITKATFDFSPEKKGIEWLSSAYIARVFIVDHMLYNCGLSPHYSPGSELGDALVGKIDDPDIPQCTEQMENPNDY